MYFCPIRASASIHHNLLHFSQKKTPVEPFYAANTFEFRNRPGFTLCPRLSLTTQGCAAHVFRQHNIKDPRLPLHKVVVKGALYSSQRKDRVQCTIEPPESDRISSISRPPTLATLSEPRVCPAGMSTFFMPTLLSVHFVFAVAAAPIPEVARQRSTAGGPVQSHTLSTEALLTLIGVCVAVFGIVLTLILSWPSLKITWGRCTSRRSRHPSRSRPVSTGTSTYKRWNQPANTDQT